MKLITRTSRIFAILVCLIILIGITSQLLTESTWFTSGIAYLSNDSNFHVVKEGSLYRSGALSKDELIKIIKGNNIKLVIDLRRSGDDSKKYGFSESEITEALGAKYESIPMVGSNTKQFSPLTRLIELTKEEHGPVLIHCSSGTHRTGVASAVWLMEKEGISPEEASVQLSSDYGYFSLERTFKSYITGSKTIDYVIWNYLSSFRVSGIKFSEWLSKTKDPL